MTHTADYFCGEQAAEQQSAEIRSNDKTGEVGGETFDLGTHAQQGCEQAVGEQQQPVAEQNRTEGGEGPVQDGSGTGPIPGFCYSKPIPVGYHPPAEEWKR